MTNRRKFIKQAAVAGIAGSIVTPLNILSQRKPDRCQNFGFKIACWCNLSPDFSGDNNQMRMQMDYIEQAGIDILLPFIQSNNYNTDAEDKLQRLLISAKERGVQVQPVVSLPLVGVLELSKEEINRRSYLSGRPGGHQFDGRRLCASWRETRKSELKIIKDIIKTYRVDGIHLDYIRYIDTDQSLKWPCRCDACQNTYKHLFGKNILTAEDLKIPGILQKFLNFRGENIRSLVEQARGIAEEAGIFFSMAARADYFGDALVEGQDWVQWGRDGLMDIICPMNYSTNREIHRTKLSSQLALIGTTVPIYDGIGRRSSAGELTTKEMIEQAEDALQLGASGISIFKFSAMGQEDFRELGAFKRANINNGI
ncbi:MAG: twin-arginine translocation signal domain-containing protein [Mangrovibacterium sp.]